MAKEKPQPESIVPKRILDKAQRLQALELAKQEGFSVEKIKEVLGFDQNQAEYAFETVKYLLAQLDATIETPVEERALALDRIAQNLEDDTHFYTRNMYLTDFRGCQCDNYLFEESAAVELRVRVLLKDYFVTAAIVDNEMHFYLSDKSHFSKFVKDWPVIRGITWLESFQFKDTDTFDFGESLFKEYYEKAGAMVEELR